jgi:uncharacterized protein YggE
MNLRVILLPLVAAAVLAVACKPGDTVVQNSETNLSGVSATGTGKAIGEPDIAVLTVGVNVRRDTVETARSDAAAAQKAVIDSLKANGVKDNDLQTVQFSIYPEYDYSRGGATPRIIGYTVSNVVTAKVRDLDKTGKAIDDASKAGGNDAVVQNVSFTIDDPEALRAQARRQAVQLGKAQAEQMADAAGAKLGKLLSISESSAAPVPYPRGLDMAAAADTQTPIETGQLEISVTVSMLYALD